MNDLVSIVVPVYNRRAEIGKAVDSILKQTYSHWEAIIVDDGSTDDTVEIVTQYTSGDERISLLRHELRKGAQAARNAGIRAAEGEWIAFLDSDDWWVPDSLEVRLRLAREKGLHVVHSECYILTPGGREAQPYGVAPIQGWAYKELLRRPGPMFPGLLVRKAALVQIGYLDEAVISFQEWDTAIRLAKHYEFGFVPMPTFIYDCRGGDTISKDRLRTAMGYERVFRKYWWPILRYSGPKALADHYEAIAGLYHEAEEEAKAVEYFAIANLWWPLKLSKIIKLGQRFLRSAL